MPTQPFIVTSNTLKSFYARQKQVSKQIGVYDSDLHKQAIQTSYSFCKRCVYGFIYKCSFRGISMYRAIADMRRHGIVISHTTINRLRNGRFTHTNSLTLSYLAAYHSISLDEMSEYGVNVLSGNLAIKGYSII